MKSLCIIRAAISQNLAGEEKMCSITFGGGFRILKLVRIK